jgi:hypothetical protein
MDTREFLCISRGQWDRARSREEIQRAIDDFYVWIDRLVADGKLRHGQRLGTGGKTVAKNGLVTDGPYGEAKELVGGYWFILARTLDEAVEIVSSSPCLPCGLFYEVRPVDRERASAFAVTNETPRDA